MKKQYKQGAKAAWLAQEETGKIQPTQERGEGSGNAERKTDRQYDRRQGVADRRNRWLDSGQPPSSRVWPW